MVRLLSKCAAPKQLRVVMPIAMMRVIIHLGSVFCFPRISGFDMRRPRRWLGLSRGSSCFEFDIATRTAPERHVFLLRSTSPRRATMSLTP